MTGTSAQAVACGGVGISYGTHVVIPMLDLDVAHGEMVVLLGPSGSGKTSLLSAVAGFIPIDAGQIAIDGRVVASAGHTIPPDRRDIAVVFQSYALWPHLDALETVAYPLRRRGIGPVAARARAVEILEMLGIGGLAQRRPSELSGGEQQRVGLGRALAREAGLFLFDEPTAHLDATIRDQLQAEIAAQRRRTGAAGIYATHDTAEALALADRVVLLREGRVVQEGPPQQVYDRPVDRWAAALTGPASVINLAIDDPADGHGRLAAEDSTQLVVVAGNGPLRKGPADAIARPDWIRFGGDLAGRITTAAFRGSHTDYLVETTAGVMAMRVPGPPAHAADEAVGITVDRAWIPS